MEKIANVPRGDHLRCLTYSYDVRVYVVCHEFKLLIQPGLIGLELEGVPENAHQVEPLVLIELYLNTRITYASETVQHHLHYHFQQLSNLSQQPESQSMYPAPSSPIMPLFPHLFKRRKLYYEGPNIFVYIVNQLSDDIDSGTVVVLDTKVGGWISLPSQCTAASLPERRQMRGTLFQLERFLQGLRAGETQVTDAILAYTRGFEMKYTIHESLLRPCDGCTRVEPVFDCCVVLEGIPGFGGACASCIMNEQQDSCCHNDTGTESSGSDYVDSDEDEPAVRGTGTKDN